MNDVITFKFVVQTNGLILYKFTQKTKTFPESFFPKWPNLESCKKHRTIKSTSASTNSSTNKIHIYLILGTVFANPHNRGHFKKPSSLLWGWHTFSPDFVPIPIVNKGFTHTNIWGE